MSEIEIKDRILRFLTRQQLSSARFADIIGVQRSSISHILSGRNNPSLDFLQKVLLNFPKLNAEWLVLGKGEMFTENSQSQLNFDLSKESQSVVAPAVSESQTRNAITHEETVKESRPRLIKKVVVFYDDNTFEELKPKKEKAEET
ncbi:MAG: helix-turn-helix transcriptional regulator [Bacteroidales bacterium]